MLGVQQHIVQLLQQKIKMVKDTCRKEKCALWDLFQDGKVCPNYFENTFYPVESADNAYTVCDCAPIRTMLILKEQHGLMISTQKVLEGSRKSVDNFNRILLSIKTKQIEKEENGTKQISPSS